MNNTTQKNIVLSLDINNVMPHDNNVNRVNEFSTADINANFKQLLDNDFFINQSIIDNTSRQIGARYFDDNISSLPNGSKIWNEDIKSGDAIVYRKQDHELSDNIIRTISGNVNLIQDFNNSKYVATNIGFKTTNDFLKYDNVDGFPAELCVNRMIVDEYGTEAIVGTNNGIFQYSNQNWIRLDEQSRLSDVTSILETKKYDLIGTKNGTYIGKLSSDNFSYEGYYGTGTVNDIAIRKVNEKDIDQLNKNIILACDNGLYHSDVALKATEFRQFDELKEKQINTTVKFKGIRYFGTNRGLYKLIDEKIEPVEEITGNVRFLRVIEDYLVVCAEWSVWIISNDGDIDEKLSKEHTEFISYTTFKNYNFAASKNKIFVRTKDNYKWEELDISDKISNSEIVDIGTMQNMFYIVCSDKILGGDITAYDILTHKIQLGFQFIKWNVTGIFGKYIVIKNGTNAEIYSNEDRDTILTVLTNVDSKVVAITRTEHTILVADESKVWIFDYNFENKEGPYEINTETGDKIFAICTFDFGRKYVILTKHGYIGSILNNKIVCYDLGANITSWYIDEYRKTLIVFTETGAYEISEKIIKTPILSAFTFDGNYIHGIINLYKVCNLYDEQRIEIGSMLRILTKDKRYNVKIINSENETQTYEVTEASDGYDFIQPELQNSDRLWCVTSGDNTIHVCENLSGIPGNELTTFALGHNSYGLIQTNQDDKIISYDDSNIYCSEKEIVLRKFLNQSGINGIFVNTCTYQDTDDEGNPITEKTEILGFNINGSNKFSLIDNVSGLVSTTLLNDTKKIRSYEKNLLGLHAGEITKAPFQLTATLPDGSDVKIKFNTATSLSSITNIIDFETDVNINTMYLITENTSGVRFLVGSLSDIVTKNLSSHTDYTNHFSTQPLSSDSRFKKLIQLSSNLDDEIEICHIGINTKNGVWYKSSNSGYEFYNFTSESETMNGFELTENGIVALISKDEQQYLKFRKYGDVSYDKIISNVIPSNINITDIFGDTNETYKVGIQSNNVIYGHDDNNNVYNIEYSDTTGYKLVSTPYYTASPDDKNTVIYDTELMIIRNDGIYKKSERQKYDKLVKLHEVNGNDLRSVQIYNNKIITLQDDYIKVYDFNAESGPELNVSLPNEVEKLGFFIKNDEITNSIGYIYKEDNKTYIDGWEFDQLSELDNKKNEFSYIIEKDNINSIYNNNEILIDGKNPFLLLEDTGIEYIDSYEGNSYVIGVLTEFENIDGVIVGVQTDDNNYFFKDDGLYIPVINDDNEKQLSLYIGNEQLGIKDGETVTDCFSSNNVLFVKVGQNSIIQIYDLHNKLSDRTDRIKVNGIINEDQMIIGNGNGLYRAYNIIRTGTNFIEKYSGDVDGENKIRQCTFLNDKIHTKQYSKTIHENEYVQIFDYSYNLSKNRFDIPLYGGMEDDTLINDIFYYQIENKDKSHIIYDNKLFYYDHDMYNEFPENVGSKINNIVYDSNIGKFYILTDYGLYQYKNVKLSRIYVNEINHRIYGKIFSIFKVTDTEFILCTENGLVHYICDYINNIRYYEDSILNEGISKKIVERVINGEKVYFTSVNNKIYNSDKLSRWKLFLELPETVSCINDFYINSYYNMAFATNDGIYRPQYKFDLINDYPKFTNISAEQMFVSHEADIDNYISLLIKNHESTMHGPNSSITLINTLFEPNEFNGISGWTKTNINDDGDIGVISNDIIKNIYSNETLGNLISLSVQNFYTNNELVEIGNIDYILKVFSSDLFELYVHIPTTMTYYLPHVNDVFACDISSTQVVLERKNLPRSIMYQNSEISTHFTTVDMKIDDSILSIDMVYDSEINGISLPLKIYRDNENMCGENGDASTQFHSLILPSIKGYSTEQNYKFYVFGTDEQVIRIFGKLKKITKLKLL